MKRKPIFWIIGSSLIIISSNIFTSCSNIMILFFEGKFIETGTDTCYITKDRKFPTQSFTIWKDYNSSNYRYYAAYRKAYPQADTALYRIHPIRLYRFWRWGEYLVHPYWHQLYMEISYKEWDKIMMQMWGSKDKYGNPFPKDIVSLQK